LSPDLIRFSDGIPAFQKLVLKSLVSKVDAKSQAKALNQEPEQRSSKRKLRFTFCLLKRTITPTTFIAQTKFTPAVESAGRSGAIALATRLKVCAVLAAGRHHCNR
jgi:hypothetical protein